MKPTTILFDINETVLNLAVLRPKFQHILGDANLTETWFSMLLHSSTVCLATKLTTNFASLAGIALESLAARKRLTLTAEETDEILSTFANLQAHSDITPALTQLKQAGFNVVALSNSSQALLVSQLTHAGLMPYFDDIISVERASTFKPSADAYRYAAKVLDKNVEELMLVATHDWDTHGAMSAGLQAAYIDRSGAPYHRLYLKPEIMATNMQGIAQQIIELT